MTFWSDKWEKLNSLSGAEVPASFKGFANSTSAVPPSSGGTWTTTTGNSPPPPDSIPSFMGVIISSSITQSRSQISGDIRQLVIVQTNAGYAPDPGHAGTGTVVGTLP